MMAAPNPISSEQRVSQLEEQVRNLKETHAFEIRCLLDRLERELVEARSRLREELLGARPSEQAKHRGEQTRQAAELAGEIDSLQHQLSWTERRLMRLERSFPGRLVRACDRIENQIAPVGSRRRRATATLRTGMTVLLTEGTGTFAAVLGRWLLGERGYWKRLVRRKHPNEIFGGGPDAKLSSKAVILIDEPARDAEVPFDARVVGLAFDPTASLEKAPGVDTVRIYLGSRATGRLLAEVRPTVRRTDQAEALGLEPGREFCGFEAELEDLPPGEQFLTVCSIREGRVTASVAWLVTVSAPPAESRFRLPPISDSALRAFSLREEPGEGELRRQIRSTRRWPVRPGFDLVSRAGEASARDLEATFESLRQQTYEDWTWHVEAPREREAAVASLAAGDNRVRTFVVPADSAWEVPGRREFVIPVRPGDLLAPNALHAVASEIRLHPEAALVFTDDDCLDDQGRRRKPFFKPDWSPELALSINVLKGLAAFRRSRLAPSDRLDLLADGLGAWEVSLRVHREGGVVRHVPALLCHRKSRKETDSADATVSMLARSLALSGVSNPEVVADQRSSCLRLRWEPSSERLVSIVIASRTPALAARCLESLLGCPENVRFEVVVVTTGGRLESWLSLREKIADPRVEFLPLDLEGEAFNFHKACHAGRERARGTALLFLNDDVVIRQEWWLSRLVQWLDLDGVGAVGPKLLYPDGRIQHAGVVFGMTGFASHVFRGQVEGTSSCFVSDEWYRNCSALTAACLLIPSQVFDQAGGFDERFTLLFGDVDLCLRLRRAGWRLVYTPDVRLVHAESGTRHGERADRVPRSDWELLTRLWLPALITGDPFYNRNLSVGNEQPDLKSGPEDIPVTLNEQWMARLPDKPMITLPNDLVSAPVGDRAR